MRNIVLFCLLVTRVQGAIQNVSVLGTTATQALIHYTAPNNAPCNVEVSESSTYSPLVNDVDGTKFASAPSDARPGGISNGVERLFVVGKRDAEVGLDTMRYSRALQTATQHYFRITCPTTGDQATGNFQTTTIPFGNTYAEAEASDPNQPGSYAYPTLSITDRTQTVIDPQTGLLLKRLNLPKDVIENVTGMPMNVIRGPGWSNLQNLGAADGNSATVSGSTAQVFMGLANEPYSNFQHYTSAAYQGATGAFGHFQVHLLAAVNPGGTAPANPADATIVACLTKNGVTCYPGSSQYQATLTPSYADTPFGTLNDIDLWQSSPSTTLPNWSEQDGRFGTVYCDGSSNVYPTSGATFGINLGPGSNININGVDYPIAQLVHTGQLTVTSTCPAVMSLSGSFDQGSNTFRTATPMFQSSNAGAQIAIAGAGGGTGPWFTTVGQVIDSQTITTNDNPSVTGVNTQFGFTYGYSTVNFGVLISKKTASSDTIAIDYASVNYDMDMYSLFLSEGGLEFCGKNTVIGPNGRPGYDCLISGMANMYWIDAESAETHFMGLPQTAPYYSGCGAESQGHDLNNPDILYCSAYGTLYKFTYYGNHSEPVAINPAGNWGLDQLWPNCNTAQGSPPYTNQQPCNTVQPLTPGTDVITLAGAFTQNPAYAPAMDTVNFRNLIFHMVDENGNMIFTSTRGNQDTLGWNIVFSPSATSNVEGGTSTGPLNNFGCVGGGQPGCVIAAMPGWARPGCRWCVIKDALSPYPGWMSIATYGWGCCSPGGGPYYVQVVDGTPNGTLNYLDGTTSLVNCPANPFGATGMNCSMLTVGSEPFSQPHGAGETGLPGEMGNAQVGDRFATDVQLPINATEQMMLIAKTPGSVAGTWVYTLWRKINVGNGATFATTGPNPNLFTVCGANQVLSDQPSSNAFYWNFLADPHGMNTTGQTIPPNPTSANGHQFFAHGNFGGDSVPSGENRCVGFPWNCYQTVLLNGRDFVDVLESPMATGVQVLNPGFGQGSADSSDMQSHPTGGGVSAPADRFNFMFDGRPYYGGYNAGLGGNSPGTLVSGQLYKFPASSMAAIDLPFRKTYPTSAFTGQLPLVDISSPATGNVLGTGTQDSYKYCVAAAVNECRQGSAVGDVYVNAPYVRYPYCVIEPQNGNLYDEYDICISGSLAIRDAITQVNMQITDNEGHATRVLTKYRRARVLNIFDTPYVLPNGQWLVFEAHFAGDASLNKVYFLGKIPPPAPEDSYNRTDFIPISVNLPALNGASQAFVRFGYAENGASTSLFCTSRQESCVVGTQTASTPVDHVNPFFLEQTEAGNWNAAACSAGCTITVPGIPQRMMYYQFVYKNSSGGIVFTSPVSATVVP
jgi:hypothetical protein